MTESDRYGDNGQKQNGDCVSPDKKGLTFSDIIEYVFPKKDQNSTRPNEGAELSAAEKRSIEQTAVETFPFDDVYQKLYTRNQMHFFDRRQPGLSVEEQAKLGSKTMFRSSEDEPYRILQEKNIRNKLDPCQPELSAAERAKLEAKIRVDSETWQDPLDKKPEFENDRVLLEKDLLHKYDKSQPELSSKDKAKLYSKFDPNLSIGNRRGILVPPTVSGAFPLSEDEPYKILLEKKLLHDFDPSQPGLSPKEQSKLESKLEFRDTKDEEYRKLEERHRLHTYDSSKPGLSVKEQIKLESKYAVPDPRMEEHRQLFEKKFLNLRGLGQPLTKEEKASLKFYQQIASKQYQPPLYGRNYYDSRDIPEQPKQQFQDQPSGYVPRGYGGYRYGQLPQ